MSLPQAPAPAAEWELQARAREEEGSHAAATADARLNRYRLIARVLREPLGHHLPDDFAVSLLASPPPAIGNFPTVPRLGAVLICAGAAYVAVLGVAALLLRADIRYAFASFDHSIVLMVLAAGLAQATPRCAALLRRLRPARG
jgi:hypothetical protein